MQEMSNSAVTISPDVIRTIVRNTILAMPNVRGLLDSERRFGSRERDGGVQVHLGEGDVKIGARVVAAADASLVELGREIQTEVVSVIEEIVGMRASSVDVTFEDVQA
jgi:uncharacterized alkaline shock family protein YloU